MYNLEAFKMVMSRLREKLRKGLIDEDDLLDFAQPNGGLEEQAAWSLLVEETRP